MNCSKAIHPSDRLLPGLQLVLERTEEGWRATEHGTDIEGTGQNAARAAEDYCRCVAEQVEAPELGHPTEGSA